MTRPRPLPRKVSKQHRNQGRVGNSNSDNYLDSLSRPSRPETAGAEPSSSEGGYERHACRFLPRRFSRSFQVLCLWPPVWNLRWRPRRCVARLLTIVKPARQRTTVLQLTLLPHPLSSAAGRPQLAVRDKRVRQGWTAATGVAVCRRGGREAEPLKLR